MENSWNATVRCHVMRGSRYLTDGKVYFVKNGVLIDDEGNHYNGGKVHSLEELNGISSPAVSFELVPDLPRIFSLLPDLKPWEHFKVKGFNMEFWFDDDGVLLTEGDGQQAYCLYALTGIFNDPNCIIRSLQFSEDDTATMRQLVKAGLPWVARDSNNDLYAFSKMPTQSSGYFDGTEDDDTGIPNAFFPQITPENSPFDCEGYLKSHK